MAVGTELICSRELTQPGPLEPRTGRDALWEMACGQLTCSLFISMWLINEQLLLNRQSFLVPIIPVLFMGDQTE